MSQGFQGPCLYLGCLQKRAFSDSPNIIAFDCSHSRHLMIRPWMILGCGLPGIWTSSAPLDLRVVCISVMVITIPYFAVRTHLMSKNEALAFRISLQEVNSRTIADSLLEITWFESRTPLLERSFAWDTWKASSFYSSCFCISCWAHAYSPQMKRFAGRMVLTKSSSTSQDCLHLGKSLFHLYTIDTKDTGQWQLFVQMSALQFLKEY